MKAITLHQPWASAIFDGKKSFETRSWKTNHRGLLAIHAGKRIDKPFAREMGYDPSTLPYGAILGVVELLHCLECDRDRTDMFSPQERRWGDFTPGRFMWNLNVVSIFKEPVKIRGWQGLWNWDPEKSGLMLGV